MLASPWHVNFLGQKSSIFGLYRWFGQLIRKIGSALVLVLTIATMMREFTPHIVREY